jgi:hypothetical protein
MALSELGLMYILEQSYWKEMIEVVSFALKALR